jgi:hypothetical protein
MNKEEIVSAYMEPLEGEKLSIETWKKVAKVNELVLK